MKDSQLTDDQRQIVQMLHDSSERRLAKAREAITDNPDSETISWNVAAVAGHEVQVRIYARFLSNDSISAHDHLGRYLFDQPRSTDQFANAMTLARAEGAQRVLHDLKGLIDGEELLSSWR